MSGPPSPPAKLDPVGVAGELVERFASRAASYDDEAAFPEGDIDDLRRSGLCGLLVPRRLGGMGAGFADYLRVATVLARGNASTALLFNMHASVTGALAGIPDEVARQLGASERFLSARDRILQAAAGRAFYGVAISEPQVGSRLSDLQTSYEKEGEGYRLRGRKSFCSGAGHLDGYLVAARATAAQGEGEPDPSFAISYFLVPGEAVVEVDASWNPLGMRATASNGFHMDAHVPEEALLGGVKGLAVALAYAMPQWLVASYAAVYVGLAQAALDEAIGYVTRRVAPATAGASPQKAGLAAVGWVRGRLGRADVQVEAARLVLEEAGRRVDAAPGEAETNRWVYRAKLMAGDAAMDVAASLAEACGLGALQRGGALERIVRDARSGALMPPSSDLCADVLGATALGLDPSTDPQVRPW